MLPESKDPFVLESWYDWIRHNGGYDYTKNSKLTNHTIEKYDWKKDRGFGGLPNYMLNGGN